MNFQNNYPIFKDIKTVSMSFYIFHFDPFKPVLQNAVHKADDFLSCRLQGHLKFKNFTHEFFQTHYPPLMCFNR